MSRTDFLPAFDPVRPIHDSAVAVQAAVPQAALALLPTLHREAGRDLGLWRFLTASPQFCIALMLQGAVALWAGSGALDAGFVWAAAILVGIAAVTGNHIRGVASCPRQVPLSDMARELRLLLVYLGVAWGFGAFLILPHVPALGFLFAVIPSLTAALILRDEKSTIAFGGPITLLTAGAVLLSRGAGQAWAGAILAAGLGIIVLSLFQRAMLRAQDLH